MPVEIRILRAGDEGVLQNADPDVFDDPVDPKSAVLFLADPLHHIVVALDGSLVVGFASAVHYFHPDKPAPELWINEVGVAGTHRGQGIAKRILKALFDVARDKGCTLAWVLTNRDNTAARRLYESAGGVEQSDDNVLIEFSLADG